MKNIFELVKIHHSTPLLDKEEFIRETKCIWKGHLNDPLTGILLVNDYEWMIMVEKFLHLAWDVSEPDKRTIDNWSPGYVAKTFSRLVLRRNLTDEKSLFNGMLFKKQLAIAAVVAYLHDTNSVSEGFLSDIGSISDTNLKSILSDFELI